MKWKIVTDSGSDIRKIDHLNDDVAFESVPLMLNIGNKVYVDDENVDLGSLMDAMEGEASASSSACPAPNAYAETYKGADNVIVFTLSANLSGSYNSASLGRDLILENNPDANIFVFDSLSAGAEMNLLVRKAAELANQGLEFDELVSQLKAYHANTTVAFLLESVDNLVKNGRVNKIVGQMIGLLGIRLVGRRTDEGRIELAHKSKGNKRAMRTLIGELVSNGYRGGDLEITHAANLETAEAVKAALLEKFPQTEITILQMSGLCSFYAQRKGLIIGYQTI